MAIQGHVFWGQWKSDKGLILYNNVGQRANYCITPPFLMIFELGRYVAAPIQCAAKEFPKVFLPFRSNCSEFLNKISDIYYSFIIT